MFSYKQKGAWAERRSLEPMPAPGSVFESPDGKRRLVVEISKIEADDPTDPTRWYVHWIRPGVLSPGGERIASERTWRRWAKTARKVCAQ